MNTTRGELPIQYVACGYLHCVMHNFSNSTILNKMGGGGGWFHEAGYLASSSVATGTCRNAWLWPVSCRLKIHEMTAHAVLPDSSMQHFLHVLP